MGDPCSKETNDKVMDRIEQGLSIEQVCDKYNALLAVNERLTHAVNDRDCEIERLRKFAKRGPYDESAASRAMHLQARVEALEARQRYLCDCLEAVGVDSSAALQAEPLAATEGES